MPRKIILDCDPGHDDAIAILLAHGNPEIELAAITTVAGNQTLPKVTRNALRICTVAGIHDVPVAAGCVLPLVREQVIAENIHGDSGLDGPDLPEPEVKLDDRHAVDLIIELVMTAEPGEITLVPVGPLTNIAMAMRREPRIVDRVREVVLMGGAYTRGNSTPAAEFNIFADPEAAAAVFDASWTVTMVGLDLTHQAGATPEVQERIQSIGTPLAGIVVGWLKFFGSTYSRVEGMTAPPVHDPCAVARIIRPDLVETVPASVHVETRGVHTYGMTVTNFRPADPDDNPTLVATKLDAAGFWDLVIDAIEAIGPPEGVPQ
jgi:purine nucleosidase